jgi:hypothetical protein
MAQSSVSTPARSGTREVTAAARIARHRDVPNSRPGTRDACAQQEYRLDDSRLRTIPYIRGYAEYCCKASAEQAGHPLVGRGHRPVVYDHPGSRSSGPGRQRQKASQNHVRPCEEPKEILPGPQGPVYSTQLQCFNPADRMRKKVGSNLIIRPARVNQISIGPEFSGLKIYQCCPA